MQPHEIHEIIQKIVPIHGISIKQDESITVQYISDPTENQLTEVNNILNNLNLYDAKNAKYEEIEDWFNKLTSDGYTTSYGWKLGLNLQDITLLSSFFLLAKTASDNNLPLPDVIDTTGISHSLTIEELTMLMLQYGQYRAQISVQYANKRKLVENATTIEELNNI